MSQRLLTYSLLWILIALPMHSRTNTNTQENFHGIDVSWYQKKIDWDVAARDKRITFAFIKATEGARLQDSNYRYNLENARRKGIKVGSYHFLRPESPVKQQFENFKARVKQHEQDLIPVIDIEDVPEMGIRWKPQQARDFLKEMADLVEKHYGARPMIYTSNKFFTDYLGRAFADYPLFIARYGNIEPEPLNGTSWTLWQFTRKGSIEGIDHHVDLSRFNKGRSLASIALHKGKTKNKSRKQLQKNKHKNKKAETAKHKKNQPKKAKQDLAKKNKSTGNKAVKKTSKTSAKTRKNKPEKRTSSNNNPREKSKKKS